MILNIQSNLYAGKKLFINTQEESLRDMIQTPKGSRVMRPHYGSEFYRLVDKTLNDMWIIQAKKAILESTRSSITDELWDERVNIKELKISFENSEAVIEVTLW